MAEKCELNINNKCIANNIPKRNNYFKGKRISAEDLTLEQRYYIDKIKRIHGELIGYGIVDGLTISEIHKDTKKIKLNQGIGIDSCGNLLALYRDRVFDLPEEELNEGDYIYLKYVERGSSRVARGDGDSCSEECCYNHIVEDMEIYIDKRELKLEADSICVDRKSIAIEREELLRELNYSEAIDIGELTREVYRPSLSLKKRNRLRDRLMLLNRIEEETPPFLLLGRYVKSRNRGMIDTSNRTYLYTNAQLSKLLCQISHHHVSSLNGEVGDVSAISSINTIKPNSSGAFEIVAGNNISITNEDSKLKISTRGGFHKEHLISLSAGDSKEFEHNRGTFPTVDIYRRVAKVEAEEESSINQKGAYLKIELEEQARALDMEFEDFMEMNSNPEPIPISTHHKNRSVKRILRESNVYNVSPQVVKILDKKVDYYRDTIYLLPEYSYEKVIGEESYIKIIHIDRNIVRIEDIRAKYGETSTEKLHYLVILNT